MAWEQDQCLIKVDPQPCCSARLGRAVRGSGSHARGCVPPCSASHVPQPAAQTRPDFTPSAPSPSHRGFGTLSFALTCGAFLARDSAPFRGCLPAAKRGLLHQHHTALPSCPHLGTAKQCFAEQTEGDLPRAIPHCPCFLTSPQHGADLSYANPKAGVRPIFSEAWMCSCNAPCRRDVAVTPLPSLVEFYKPHPIFLSCPGTI